MECYCCSDEFADLLEIWSPYWWDAKEGPISICKDCQKQWQFNTEEHVTGQQAREFFDSVKQFVNFRDPSFCHLRKELMQGKILQGNAGEYFTLGCKLWIEYNSDVWLVCRYSCINFGKDYKWSCQ